MSLDQFQRALADIVASPQRCLALRQDSSLLDAYDLEPRERQRLLAMVRHEGMSHNCTLYRANRLTPLVRSLPRTCELLGDQLAEVLEQFWVDRPDAEVQFKLEAERFSQYILQHGIPDIKKDDHLLCVLQEEIDGLDERFGLDNHP